ncbi:MAG: peptidase and in kexin sedolisin [Clostridia bacterium]|jgi:hypothetical protein|nr:peptidase and in kexin sedolisin [Clostridia bacterium]
MFKKFRSVVLNVGLAVAVTISSLFMMGAYDPSCGDEKYSEIVFAPDVVTREVNIIEGSEASIPMKVIITMQGDYTLQDVYGDHYNRAEISIDSAFNQPGITIGPTYRTNSTSTPTTTGSVYTLTESTTEAVYGLTETTTGSVYTLTADVHLTNTLPSGDYSIPVIFSIYNIKEDVNFTLGQDILVHITRAPLGITSTNLIDGIVGTNYSTVLAASGGSAPYTWDVSGLPPELKFDVHTGEISGIPTVEGSYPVLVTVRDGAETPNIAFKSLTLLVKPALEITTSRLTNGTVGTNYSTVLAASGGSAPYTWEVNGLPTGLNVDAGTGEISGIPKAAGTFAVHITVTDNSITRSSKDIDLIITPRSSSGSDSTPATSPKPPLVNIFANMLDTSDRLIESIAVGLNKDTGVATIQVKDKAILDDAFSTIASNNKGIKTMKIKVPAIAEAKEYHSILPAGFWTLGDGSEAIEIQNDIASITIPNNMLSTIDISKLQYIGLTIASVNKEKLDLATREIIKDRPIIEIKLHANGQRMPWSNENVPVTISVPYTPTPDEMKDLEHITVWYIDGEGKAVAVPNGKYNPETGCVTFRTTHFSKYAVVFVQKHFNDINSSHWAKKSIEILASKGIISKKADANFQPSRDITRADFLEFLVKTLGLRAQVDGSFSDVKPDKYYYEAVRIAKKLDIATGSDNNIFNPEAPISRQDMMVMTERALNIVSGKTVKASLVNLNQFSDKDKISEYAKASVSILVANRLIGGSNGKINPLSNTTRAEAAAFLYKIYNQY